MMSELAAADGNTGIAALAATTVAAGGTEVTGPLAAGNGPAVFAGAVEEAGKNVALCPL